MSKMITIHLCRTKAGSSSAHDDIIRITRSDNNFLVRYTDKQGGSETHQKLLLTNTSLGSYICNLGYMLLHDAEPFEAFQFAFPGFPLFLVSRETLSNTETQDALMEIADIVGESMLADSPSENTPSRHVSWDCNDDFCGHY